MKKLHLTASFEIIDGKIVLEINENTFSFPYSSPTNHDKRIEIYLLHDTSMSDKYLYYQVTIANEFGQYAMTGLEMYKNIEELKMAKIG